jgi:micrococcal nuclease
MAAMTTAPHHKRGFRALQSPAWALALLLILSATIVSGPARAEGPTLRDACPALEAGGEARVESVSDGDTLTLDDGQVVRLVGLQAPKLPLGREGLRAWPLAEEARAHLESLAAGAAVRLHFGTTREDRHGRLLAHLERADDGLWLQGAMLRDGWARVYSFADNRQCVGAMLAIEQAARAGRKGIWRHPNYAIRTPDEALRRISRFEIVEGVVTRAANVRGRIFLGFGRDWRRDFAITIARGDAALFAGGARGLMALEGERVRVRGWITARDGAQITLTHPEQIEVMRDGVFTVME